ncbi:sensor histidine kinase [Tepidibacter mesophilus]|uniref:sensor histidine kinase n=1 Tax=Tepidibacter mesophilus TaxID=655607 RepID=UPI000C0727FB|nr:HAMP domain-containing sensor histidine kinase [Tepidibacter mesophilus]
MNKLSKKLSIRISTVIAMVFLFSFLLNNYFLSRYYLSEMKGNLDKISNHIQAMDLSYFLDNIDELEEKYNVTIVYHSVEDTTEGFNESMKAQFGRKNIKLNKFWVHEVALDKIKEEKIVKKIYNQGKIKSSFLVAYIKKENIAIAIGVSIVHDRDTIKIINQFNLYLMSMCLILTITVVWVFSRKIIQPLEKLENVSKDIANLKFKKVNIKTGDEIEELAESINRMSEKLEKSHADLEEKNENLKHFISNITHEIKTPLALIKAYAMGIKDDLDDGTYIDTINDQTEAISDLIDNLLQLSKLEKDVLNKTSFDLESLFFTILEKYKIDIENKKILVSINKENLREPFIYADMQKIKMVFNNLISNAIKYTSNGEINIKLENSKDQVFFSVKNGINGYEEKEINKIWEPFYVMETSRSKQLSGTGLGLSIVKGILNKHDFEYGVKIYKKEIEFYIFLKKEF